MQYTKQKFEIIHRNYQICIYSWWQIEVWKLFNATGINPFKHSSKYNISGRTNEKHTFTVIKLIPSMTRNVAIFDLFHPNAGCRELS